MRRLYRSRYMVASAFRTVERAPASYAALLLRVTLGVVFIAHALMKALVLTLPGAAAFFAQHGFPGWTAYAVFAAELFGGLALIAGVYTRVVALGLLPVLLGALTVHWPNGWYFAAPNGGWEYIGVLLAALIVQSCLGSGHFALVRHQNGDNMNSSQVSRERKGRESSRERAQATMVIVAGAAAAATLAFASTSQTTATMSAADGATIAHRYFEEVWNRGHVDVLDELLAPDYVNHTPSAGNPAPGPNGLKPIVLAIRRAFPDLHFTIEDVVVTQDAIAIRTTMRGTHEGELFGIAPTHRAVRVMQIQIERLRKGRIVDHWRVTDDLMLMRQLGVVQ